MLIVRFRCRKSCSEFDEKLWNATVDCLIVHSAAEFTFRFKDWTELTWKDSYVKAVNCCLEAQILSLLGYGFILVYSLPQWEMYNVTHQGRYASMIKEMLEGIAGLTESEEEAAPGIVMLKFTVVNAFVVENSEDNNWILVDTGLENSDNFILKTIKNRFGENTKPLYILLTHGHFDHVGSVKKLMEYWNVPVYANERELPYLTGEKDYPEGNTQADEGLIAKMSAHFPNQTINLKGAIHPLPADGTIPGMPEWNWIATPGHTEGHISLYRKKDGVLIVGDAFTNTKQESFFSVLTQKEQIKGPPAYFTFDWRAAKESVIKLKNLHPSLALTSHGNPLVGENLKNQLDYLADNFDSLSIPEEIQDR